MTEELGPVAWLRDIDGTGSLHPCAENDPGAFPLYIRPTPAAPVAPNVIDGLRKAVEDIDDKTEARARFLEEALELVQAAGGTPGEVAWATREVFARPADPVALEVGQVVTALHRLAFAFDVDLEAEAERDRLHILANADSISERHRAKPRYSPAAPEGVGTEARWLIAAALHGEARAIDRAIVDGDDCVFIAMDDVEALLVGVLSAYSTPVADRETTTSTVDDRGPAVRGAQAGDMFAIMADAIADRRGISEEDRTDGMMAVFRRDARAAYAAAEESWTRQVVEWLYYEASCEEPECCTRALHAAANAIERREHLKEPSHD